MGAERPERSTTGEASGGAGYHLGGVARFLQRRTALTSAWFLLPHLRPPPRPLLRPVTRSTGPTGTRWRSSATPCGCATASPSAPATRRSCGRSAASRSATRRSGCGAGRSAPPLPKELATACVGHSAHRLEAAECARYASCVRSRSRVGTWLRSTGLVVSPHAGCKPVRPCVAWGSTSWTATQTRRYGLATVEGLSRMSCTWLAMFWKKPESYCAWARTALATSSLTTFSTSAERKLCAV